LNVGDPFRAAASMLGFDPTAVAEAPPQRAAPKVDPANPASWGKVGRNDACPCGSGKKYKHCHGRF